ncbi:GNAT family N-acetyltransferase [Natronosporangium hydrolyticum]|uniref:GNAT family N-acetyltransferase n=1 Tax=Natronosporangium hydrolyticum TaxID=2811111 RepID=A0A895YKL5_9ACTN|nr:GNAT family N-acetyltransferase [Natronosporangium hydrolyticum]QSB14640.1 GNAT family N-acetyltransferase [Natronosporangium hydrolyticum]
MPHLSAPTTDARASFLTAMAEFIAEGRGEPGDDSLVGAELRRFRADWATAAGFAGYVAGLRAEADPDIPRPPGRVPATTLWWLAGEVYLGRLAIRHQLTEQLREVGGHIGYDVRPSARRRGHATAMLAAALPVAASLGIDPVLITCDHDNLASRTVIERNGGVLEDQRGNKLRYWLSTNSG